MKFIIYAVYGCIIGIANIIPGVSGGTMAVILNIYDKLIDSVIGIKKHVKVFLSLYPLPLAEDWVYSAFPNCSNTYSNTSLCQLFSFSSVLFSAQYL